MFSRVVFFVPPSLTPLDLIGPLQAFKTANKVVEDAYRIEVCALSRSMLVAGNLRFANLRPYSPIKLRPDDILVVAGFSDEPEHLLRCLRTHRRLVEWIRSCWEVGAIICSICTGAYLLAEAGILDGLACATHWLNIDDMQQRYPKIAVRPGILFVQAGRIFTSAGVSSGIDLAIHIVGLQHGPKIAFEVARLLVIYLRRTGEFEQDSVYLQYRNHLDDLVHRAQSLLIEQLDRPPNLDGLAEQAGSSVRNLSRRFRQNLGLSVGEYLRELRLERARALLQEEGSKVEDVAGACGFSDPRQLRNLYRKRFGRSPRAQSALPPAKI